MHSQKDQCLGVSKTQASEVSFKHSGKITVKYDTKRPGPINKSVTITSNAINEGYDAVTKESTKIIRIKGNILPAPEGEAPVNTSGAPTNN